MFSPIDDLELDVQQAFLYLLQEFDDDVFPLNVFIASVEACGGLPIRVEKDEMPVGMTGYCVILKDCYLVCTRKGLSSTHELVVILHELWHIRRGDLKNLGEALPYYNDFIQRRDRHRFATSRQVEPSPSELLAKYKDKRERTVEILARLTAQRILAYQLRDMIASFVYGE